MPAEIEFSHHERLLYSHIRCHGFDAKTEVSKHELGIKSEDAFTSGPDLNDKQILAFQLNGSTYDSTKQAKVGDDKVKNVDTDVFNNTLCRHCQGETHGPDDTEGNAV